MRQWARRDEQIQRVMKATVGLHGDLQGMEGKTMQEIDGLEMEGAGPSVDQPTAIKRTV